MLQKLKNILAISAGLAMLTVLGYTGAAWAAGRASAGDSTYTAQLACSDKSTTFNIQQTPSFGGAIGGTEVVCQSGANVLATIPKGTAAVGFQAACKDPAFVLYEFVPANLIAKTDVFAFYCGASDSPTAQLVDPVPAVTVSCPSSSPATSSGGIGVGCNPNTTCPTGDVFNMTTRACVKNIYNCAPNQVYVPPTGPANGCQPDPNDPSDSGDGSSSVCLNGATPTTPNDPSTCPAVGDSAAKGGSCTQISNCDLINNYVQPAIDFLAALVGLAVVISVVIGGIEYSSSAGDPQRASAARARIRNAIIALITFIFLYAMLNFLIPGGLSLV